MKKIKLPDFGTFKSNSKEYNPYILFYNWVIEQEYPLNKVLKLNLISKINVSKIGLTKEDDEKLFKIIFHWTKKYYWRLQKLAEEAAAMERLSIGPRVLYKEDYPDIESGYVYLIPSIFKDS